MVSGGIVIGWRSEADLAEMGISFLFVITYLL